MDKKIIAEYLMNPELRDKIEKLLETEHNPWEISLIQTFTEGFDAGREYERNLQSDEEDSKSA